jgi:hypothetical protein
VERRPCALSAQHQVGALLWFKPVHCRCPDELLEASGWWRLGPSRSGVGLMWLRGTWIGAMECRLIRLKADAYQTANLTARWKLLEQGPEKSVCFCCWLRWSVDRHGLPISYALAVHLTEKSWRTRTVLYKLAATITFIPPLGFPPNDLHNRSTPWSVFQDGTVQENLNAPILWPQASAPCQKPL